MGQPIYVGIEFMREGSGERRQGVVSSCERRLRRSWAHIMVLCSDEDVLAVVG